ncbi:MAG: penicillin-binding transpeptidase domain-containing protein [Candidatus Omnitrophica bacterium]|nr:penicillin-binding transpeptidase domain-containing protein [Candidatus Omnitrophota bacterium]
MPFSEKNIAILRDIMEVTTTEKGTLYGKTGSGMGVDGKGSLGWFVGFLEHGKTTYIFACNITGGEESSGKVAQTIIENIFKSQGFL